MNKLLYPTIIIDGEERSFVWGTVNYIHVIGKYSIVEYLSNTRGMENKTYFHSYIKNRDTNHSYLTLEEAIIGVIAYEYDGPNSQAAYFFGKMLGFKED